MTRHQIYAQIDHFYSMFEEELKSFDVSNSICDETFQIISSVLEISIKTFSKWHPSTQINLTGVEPFKDEQRTYEGYRLKFAIATKDRADSFMIWVNVSGLSCTLNTNEVGCAEPEKTEDKPTEVPTNYDMLKTMKLEEFAESLIITVGTKDSQSIPHRAYFTMDGQCFGLMRKAIEHNIEWLKKEAL